MCDALSEGSMCAMHYQKAACVRCIIRRQHVCMHYQKVACVYALSEGSMCVCIIRR